MKSTVSKAITILCSCKYTVLKVHTNLPVYCMSLLLTNIGNMVSLSECAVDVINSEDCLILHRSFQKKIVCESNSQNYWKASEPFNSSCCSHRSRNIMQCTWGLPLHICSGQCNLSCNYSGWVHGMILKPLVVLSTEDATAWLFLSTPTLICPKMAKQRKSMINMNGLTFLCLKRAVMDLAIQDHKPKPDSSNMPGNCCALRVARVLPVLVGYFPRLWTSVWKAASWFYSPQDTH